MRAQDLGLPDPFDASGECLIDPAEHRMRSRAAQSLKSVWEIQEVQEIPGAIVVGEGVMVCSSSAATAIE